MSTSLLDVARFAGFVGRSETDDAVWFAVELAESLVAEQIEISSPPQAGLTAVAFSVAARLLAAPPGVASESEGGVSFSYRDNAGELILTDRELRAIARIKGRASGLGQIGLNSPGRGRRRFDPGQPLSPTETGKRMVPVDGYWKRGPQ